ncbi:ABC transporter permease [Alkalispirochaeta sphaeroplastigenens]|uniref:ABC transporter permease n=1 Tax=Alkalispirochaeta sphaeroplastigenens TaxID=1187066 RepID=UPI001FEBF9BE|nr:ABC transporter permease [Alkalispirochaeta sphaeroplastigenens]
MFSPWADDALGVFRWSLFVLLHALAVVFLVATASFFLLQVIPGDPAAVVAGLDADEATLTAVRRSMGLDEALHLRYLRWISGLLRGRLGDSLVQRRPVEELIAQRLPVTLMLAGAALVSSVLLGLSLALLGAASRAGERIVRFLEYLAFAFPQFWVALLLIYLFSFRLGWFPLFGAEEPGALVLPALSLGISNAAVVSRTARASLKDLLRGNHAAAARALGISPRRIFLVHLLPLAMIPLVPVLVIQAGYLLAGAIVVEQVFGLPGVGRLTLTAIVQRDLPVIQGSIVVFGLAFPLLNALGDLLVGFLWPRLRLEGR